MQANFVDKTIWTGDNLNILRGLNSESVDLIYLDPPFNSNRDYEAPVGSKAAGAAFKDAWTLSDLDVAWIGLIADEHPSVAHLLDTASRTHGKGMQSYLTMMAVRLLEMRRVLKTTGSIYLHCDPTASHYLKLLMDAIFGAGLYKAEITWQRTPAHSDSRTFGNVCDKILFYGTSRINADAIRTPLASSYIKSHYSFSDKRGRYRTDNLTGPGLSSGESGQSWREYDPSDIGRCWSVPKAGKYAVWIDHNVIPGFLSMDSVLARLDALDGADMIVHSAKGSVPQLKRYLSANPGQVPSNNWTDISPINSQAKERVGYPTQKPLKLLERIIAASSNPGDMVLDPFAGCATACVAGGEAGQGVGRHRPIAKGCRVGEPAPSGLHGRLVPQPVGNGQNGHSQAHGHRRADPLPQEQARPLRRTGRPLRGMPYGFRVQDLRGGPRHPTLTRRDGSHRQSPVALLALQPHQGEP